MSTLNLASCY